MEVIILAGGMGTRLQEVVNDVPKPMAPIRNKPFLEYLINWLSDYPVTKIIFSVGYKAEFIISYFGAVFNDIPIMYALENKPLGTGGAILNALSYAEAEDVLIVNGDTYFPINLDIFSAFHAANKGGISIALKLMENFDRYGTVRLVENTIIGFIEKQQLKKGLINGGIYFIKKRFLSIRLPLEKFSFEQEILEKEAITGNLKALVFHEPFIDIGVPADYFKACNEL